MVKPQSPKAKKEKEQIIPIPVKQDGAKHPAYHTRDPGPTCSTGLPRLTLTFTARASRTLAGRTSTHRKVMDQRLQCSVLP